MRNRFFLIASLAAAMSCAPGVDYVDKELVRTPCTAVCSEARDSVIFLDFGKDAFGQLSLAFDAVAPGTLKVHLGEALENGRLDRTPPGTVRYACYDIPVEQGLHVYDIKFRPDPRNTCTVPNGTGVTPVLMPEATGEVYPFRYCELEGVKGSVDLEKTLRYAVHWPFNDSASYFSCSDTVLNRVWELCKYSIKATSFAGYYVDGDRERIPYEADALINQLSHYCVDSEYTLARKTGFYLLDHSTWPTEWQLQMPLVAWNDYLYSGSKRFILARYERLRDKALPVLRDSTGLFCTAPEMFTADVLASLNYTGTSPIKDIVDWPMGERDGYEMTPYNTVTNAFHYAALMRMADISGALLRFSDRHALRQAALRLKSSINTLLYDSEAGCYRDGLHSDHHSLHASLFPLAFGLVPASEVPRVVQFIRSKGMACSVYASQFLLEGLYNAGAADYALSLMNSTGERSWYNMIRTGSTITMEAWDNRFKPNQDWNHAWGSAPANIIQRKLIGVEPIRRGFRKVSVHPQLGGLESAEALVPTPRGGIKCNYSQSPDGTFSAGLVIPKGVKARVSLPVVPGTDASVLTVNGKPHRCRVHAGRASFTLRSGEWQCVCR